MAPSRSRTKSPLPQAPEVSAEVELAYEEGHDVDIPSSLAVNRNPRRPERFGNGRQVVHEQSNADFDNEKDVDVEKGGRLSRPLSTASKEDQCDDDDRDPNVVDWEEDDPENPYNWPTSRKWSAILLVSAITFLTPLGSSMFAPGVPQLMEEFNSDSELLAGFVVSIYVLGFAFGPLIIAPLSEMYGRLPLYHSCNWIFVAFNIACGFAPNLSALIVFRFLAGSFGAAPLALGGGTIADMVAPAQRGTAMALWMAGPTVGPVIGPVIGGFLSSTEGWRWNFYLVAIAGGAVAGTSIIVMKETYAPVLLARRVKKLKKETGNVNLKSKLGRDISTKDLFLISIIRPAKMLCKSLIVFLLSLYIAIVYSYLYILFTTFTLVFEQNYGFTTATSGLAYLGVGVGSITGQVTYTYFANRLVSRHLEKGDFKPEHRLPLMFPGAVAMPIGLFWYGWAAQAQVHYMVPLIGTSLIGFGLLMIFMAPIAYLIDVFTIYAASAMAANTVMRSACAAIIPLAGQSMYSALGLGWGNSVLGFVAVACVPIPLIFQRYGELLRTRYPVQL